MDQETTKLPNITTLLSNFLIYYQLVCLEMTKGEEKEEGNAKQAPEKKIIKKMCLKKEQCEGLRDWKPSKLGSSGQLKKNSEDPSPKQSSIASQFLSVLPKPTNKLPDHSSFPLQGPQNTAIRVKLAKTSKLTAEQIKWDIEDQTFIRKQFIPGREKQIQSKFVEGEDDEQAASEVYVDAKGKSMKVRSIDLNTVIDDNWKEVIARNEHKNEIWNTATQLLNGKGKLAKIAKEAQSKAEEIESCLNQQALESKQMRDRYGW